MQNSSRDKNLPSTYITTEIHSVLHFKVALEIEKQGEAFNVVEELNMLLIGIGVNSDCMLNRTKK